MSGKQTMKKSTAKKATTTKPKVVSSKKKEVVETPVEVQSEVQEVPVSETKKSTTVTSVKPTEKVKKFLDQELINYNFYVYRKLLHYLHGSPDSYEKFSLDNPTNKDQALSYVRSLADKFYDSFIKKVSSVKWVNKQLTKCSEEYPVELRSDEVTTTSEDGTETTVTKEYYVDTFVEYETEVTSKLKHVEGYKYILSRLRKDYQNHFSADSCPMISAFIHTFAEDLLRIGYESIKNSNKRTCNPTSMFASHTETSEIKTVGFTNDIDSPFVEILKELPTYVKVRDDVNRSMTATILQKELKTLADDFENFRGIDGTEKKKKTSFLTKLKSLIEFGEYEFEKNDKDRMELSDDVKPEKYLQDIGDKGIFSFFVNGLIRSETDEENKSLKKSKAFKNFISVLIYELVIYMGKELRLPLKTGKIKTINGTFIIELIKKMLTKCIVKGEDEDIDILTLEDKLSTNKYYLRIMELFYDRYANSKVLTSHAYDPSRRIVVEEYKDDDEEEVEETEELDSEECEAEDDEE